MPKREYRKCVVCNKEYLSWRYTQTFCSKSCAAKGVNGNTYKHGHTSGKNSLTYSSWASMNNRTKGRTEHSKKYYSNIKVCDRWKVFENFLEDMGERIPGTTLDRINPYGNYEPSNCRWATLTEQMNNLKHNKLLTFNGLTMTQEQWGRKIGLSGTIIHKRLKRGWSIEKSLTTPRVKTGHKTQ